MRARISHLSAKQILAFGFALIIFVGAFLLMMPIANRNHGSIPFVNALFTAASATCVTGLVVYDTWTQFSLFGQVIILLLIQIGGLGFMTITIFFSIVLGKRIGLKERGYLMESISALQLGGIVRLVRNILIGTAIFEGIGALILSFRFYPVFGLAKGIWYGIFHSISAFCNAGFDLMGSIKPYASLTPFANDFIVNLTVISLIIIGGVGFIVWEDIKNNKWHFKQYNLHSKIMIVSTVVLLFSSTLLLFLLENNASLAGLSSGRKILAAFFQAVTPRTAGFNTVNFAAYSEGGTLFTMFLMVIGAGPGSTGGGIKITTFIVMLLAVYTSIQQREDVDVFHRRLEPEVIKHAFVSTTSYLLLMFSGCLIIAALQDLPLKNVMFETASAIGTVGLSTGITRELLPLSRLVIILLMYSGRLGSLTVFLAATDHHNIKPLRNPEDKIIVG